jgi:hypothetical protein
MALIFMMFYRLAVSIGRILGAGEELGREAEQSDIEV